MPSKVKFQEAWMKNPEFQPWLVHDENDFTRAFCTLCKSGKVAEKSTLRRHSKRKTHLANERYGGVLRKSPTSSINVNEYAPILLYCFTAKLNLPFALAELFVELHKWMYPECDIAQNLYIKRTKCTEVIRKLGKAVNEDLATKIRLNKFSIILDETTDWCQ